MNATRILLASLALGALAVFPSGALAAALVPPGNSAANQYTETFPTPGGNAEAKGKKATPGDVLGAGNAKKLDSKGRQGREAAAVVAATAPPAVVGAGGGGTSQAPAGGGGDGSASGGSGQAGGSGEGASVTEAGSDRTVSGDTSGSSGFGEVLGQATGSSSSGGTGLLLPLIVLASVIGALAFFLRRRRQTA